MVKWWIILAKNKHLTDEEGVSCGGSGWSTIIPRTPNNGAAQWIVTGFASTQARVRVLSLGSPSVSDDSNGNFTIAGLHVTSPQGGESWRNSTMKWQKRWCLKWNFFAFSPVTVQFALVRRDTGSKSE